MKNSPILSSPAGDFRIFLQSELFRRCRRNPRYSVRAFARALGTDSSNLVKIMKGKRPASVQSIQSLGKRMGLTSGELKTFIEFHSKERESENDFVYRLTLDAFEIASDIQHYSILFLMDTDDFKSDPAWIARRLGIKPSEVVAALERLERAHFIRQNENGVWSKTIEKRVTTLGQGPTTSALRNLQRQVLERAIRAMESAPPELREQSTMFTAVDSDLVPEAKQRILKFRRSLCKFLQNGKKKDKLYALSSAFFPLSNEEKAS